MICVMYFIDSAESLAVGLSAENSQPDPCEIRVSFDFNEQYLTLKIHVEYVKNLRLPVGELKIQTTLLKRGCQGIGELWQILIFIHIKITQKCCKIFSNRCNLPLRVQFYCLKAQKGYLLLVTNSLLFAKDTCSTCDLTPVGTMP